MNNIAVGDADSLIALAYENDSNHRLAQKISEWLAIKSCQIVYPNTAIVEAITSLKRAHNLANQAHLLNRQYLAGMFLVEYINASIQEEASRIFENKAVSKQNTLFDAIVAATAQKFETNLIFSFDNWYPKLGLKLVKG